MKIINLSSYEKLKIRPVKPSNLKSDKLEMNKLDLKRLSFNDLVPGYIVKTRFGWLGDNVDNIYIVADAEYLKELIDSKALIGKYDIVFMRADLEKKHVVFKYVDEYVNLFPKSNYRYENDIVAVYEANLDFNKLSTEQSIVDLYKKYNLNYLYEHPKYASI